MKLRPGLFVPAPFLGYLAAGATKTVAIVAGIVLIVLFTFVFILMLKGMRGGGPTPVIELGKLKLLVRPPLASEQEESSPARERKRNLRERVRSLPCASRARTRR